MKSTISLFLASLFALASFAFASCAPDTPNTFDYLNTNAQYSNNVSSLYALNAIESGILIEVKWRDSTGLVHKLSDYQGKSPVIVAFGKTTSTSTDALFRELDSIRSEMGDSVFTLMIVDDNTGFTTVSNYATAKNLKGQMISDSAFRIQLQFVLHSDGLIYIPETFVLGKDGNLVTNGVTAGREEKDTLEAFVRRAYAK